MIQEEVIPRLFPFMPVDKKGDLLKRWDVAVAPDGKITLITTYLYRTNAGIL